MKDSFDMTAREMLKLSKESGYALITLVAKDDDGRPFAVVLALAGEKAYRLAEVADALMDEEEASS